MESSRNVFLGSGATHMFTHMESFKCSSVSLVLTFDYITFRGSEMSEKADSQRPVEPNEAGILKAAW